MKTLLVTIALLLLNACTALYAQIRTLTLHYENDAWELNANHRRQLDSALSQPVAVGKKLILQITGHTDSRADSAYNIDLSRKRAETVYQYILRNGSIPEAAISFYFSGEQDPLTTNATEAGRSLNRRVDIVFDEKTIPPTKTEKDNINELYQLLADEGQTFCCNPNRDTVLVGRSGTLIHYKAGTFEPVNCACIKLVVHEFFKNDQFIQNNLTTTSNGRLLQTGGMIKIEAYCEDRLLSFNPNKFLTVMVPADTLLPDMALFTASRNEPREYLNWMKNGNRLNSGLDTINIRYWSDADFQDGRSDYRPQNSGKCPLFFCKIRRWVNNIFNPNQSEKKMERYNQLAQTEKGKLSGYELSRVPLEAAMSQGNADIDALKYYVFKNYGWDYHNIDRYNNPALLTDFVVEEKAADNKDIKIIYAGIPTVVPGKNQTINYRFWDLARDQKIWLVGLKYEDKKIFLSLENRNSSDKRANLAFKQVSLEELKRELKVLN